MILLKNGTFIDWQTLEFKQTDILVDEGPEGKLHFVVEKSNTGNAKIIDCSGKFITKSFACGHHHVYSALARGMGAPKKNPENFPEILQNIWWTLDKALDMEMIRSSALVTAMACARNGVTFAIDHHASPFAVEGSLETIAQAFDEVGVGHLLCYEISDRDGIDIAKKGLAETASYLSKRQGLVGLHASFTVGDETLKHAVDLAKNTKSGIHVHVAEDESDQVHCLTHHGKRVIERFSEAGVLDFQKTILGHCLHLSKNEKHHISESPVWIVQNTESNLNNQVGNFNSAGLGKNIMIGTDGMHSDMLRSAKSAFFAGHNYDNIDYPETYRRFRNVHNYLHSNGFENDGENNLVVLDYDTPTPLTANNFLGHFLFGIEGKHARHVISNGKLIVENGKLITVNEEEILAESRVLAVRLWDKMK
jgi:cytosine/adenosine deaminase-related metal-dependent hydrolase